jgi:hypothetical protein
VTVLQYIATVADNITFAWLMFLGYEQLYQGNYTPACLLIITAVVWQRAWKVDMLKYFEGKGK